jgi:hypothetical protein
MAKLSVASLARISVCSNNFLDHSLPTAAKIPLDFRAESNPIYTSIGNLQFFFTALCSTR